MSKTNPHASEYTSIVTEIKRLMVNKHMKAHCTIHLHMRTGAEKKMLYTSATASVRTGVKRTYEYI